MKKLAKFYNSNFIEIIKILIVLYISVTVGMFSFNLFKLDIFPVKYLIISYILLLAFIIALFIIFLNFKKKKLVITSSIILILLSVILLVINGYLKNTYYFFYNAKSEYETLNYVVISLKNNNYQDIRDLENKKIGYLNDNNLKDIERNLKKLIIYHKVIEDEGTKLLKRLDNKEIVGVVLEESYYDLLKELNSNYKSKYKEITNFSIKQKVTLDKEAEKNIVSESFIIYLSGIDQYGDIMSVRGRSDVNQIIVVNPKTSKILLVNTPRDYYVNLYGTTGLKDKLTHAGIYGIDKSIKTLENLYDIDINYYARVNFNTVIKLIDIIGGVDIYSDKAFIAHTDKSVYVKKGLNTFNGKQALAYARERYTYTDGDHHRGRNQQQVITAVLEKVSNSKVLISKYNSILKVLDKSFQTDIDMDLITTFIRYQLEKMPKWKLESIQVTGYNSSNYTYSMGYSQKLYVMEPNYESVNKAKERIEEVLNDN